MATVASKSGGFVKELLNNLLGHAAWDKVKGDLLQHAGGAAVNQIKKFGKEFRLEAMLLLTMAVSQLTDPDEKAGAVAVNKYYAGLAPGEPRERFERLLGACWSVMQDGIGSLSLKEIHRTSNEKTGETTTVHVPDTKPAMLFMQHWGRVGMNGDTAIALELDKLEQDPVIKKILDNLKKVTQSAGNGLNSFFRGLRGIEE